MIIKQVLLSLSVLISFSIFSQKCINVKLNNSSESLIGIDSKIYIEEDSGGDFYFSSNDEFFVKNGESISIIFSESRFLDYYKVQLKNDNDLILLNDSSSKEVCGSSIEISILIKQNVIQKNVINIK